MEAWHENVFKDSFTSVRIEGHALSTILDRGKKFLKLCQEKPGWEHKTLFSV